MRTNTRTFRNNAFKALRAQDLTSAKARGVMTIMMRDLILRSYPVLPADTEIKVSMNSEEEQRVGFVSQMLVILELDRFELSHLQPLVNCAPTPRQINLQQEMSDMIAVIYDEMSNGEQAFADIHGAPHTEADHEAERRFVQDFAPYRDVQARYQAAKAESLAINPHVSGSIVDPERASFWYEWVREVRHYRPTGFHTIAMIDADYERLKNERPYEEAA